MMSRHLDEDRIRSLVVSQLQAWVDGLPEAQRTEPRVSSPDGNGKLSPADILQNVQDRTQLGLQLMENATPQAMSSVLIPSRPADAS